MRKLESHKVFVIGTTAEYIKIAPVLKLLRRESFSLWATNQQPQALLKISVELGYSFDKHLGLSHNSGSTTFIQGLIWLSRIHVQLFQNFRQLSEFGRYSVVVHGDTSTSTAAAICARLAGLSVAHIEAGLRSGNVLKPFPEEINRIVTARLANVHYAPTSQAVLNLAGRGGRIVPTHGNTAIDAISLIHQHAVLNFEVPPDFALVFLHRAELLKNRKKFTRSIKEIISLSDVRNIVFILDPLTEAHIRRFGLWEDLNNSRVEVHGKLPYSEFQMLLRLATYLITDSGGQQQEAAYLGLPCLVHRTVTEDNTNVGQNIRLSFLEDGAILAFENAYASLSTGTKELHVSPSDVIAKDLLTF